MQKLSEIVFTVIILIYVTAVSTSDVFEIYRRRPNEDSDGWEKGTDSFKIPPSLCHHGESNSMNCARFNAKASSNSNRCLCACSTENATFLYNKDQWKCIKNSNVSDLLGYKLQPYSYFYGEKKDSPLRMLDIGDKRKLDISRLAQNCRVDKGSSSYIVCNGNKVPFTSGLFTIQKIVDQDGSPYNLKVNRHVKNTEFLRGRIIKLGIKCTLISGGYAGNFTRWLLFKYVGNITCNTLESSVQAPVSTQTMVAAVLPSTPTRTIVNSQPTVSERPATVPDSPPNVSATPSTTSESRKTVVVLAPTSRARDIQPTKDFSSNAPPQPSSGREKSSTGGDSPSRLGLIAGIAVSLVVVVVVIVGSIIFRRRYLNNTPRSSITTDTSEATRDSVIFSSQSNPAYEPDDQNVYRSLSFEEAPIYASRCKVPHHPSADDIHCDKEKQSNEADIDQEHYASLNIQEEQNIYGLTDTQEPFYNVLESSVSDDEIIYQNYGSIAEGPVDDGVEPVYNVLEEPDLEGSESADNYGAISEEGPVDDGVEPVYNVLEEPDVEGSESADNYGAISEEGPVDDGVEPVYNVLEEPDVEGSESADNYGAISEDGPVYVNTLERSYQDGEGPNFDSESGTDEPIYNVVDEDSYPTVSPDEDSFVTKEFVKSVLKKIETESK